MKSQLPLTVLAGLLVAPLAPSAATMPPVLFTDQSTVYAAVDELPMLSGNEWEIIVFNVLESDLTIVQPWGVGMRFFNPQHSEYSMIVLADSTWVAQSCSGFWEGEGSVCYLSMAGGFQLPIELYSTPVPASTPSIEAQVSRGD